MTQIELKGDRSTLSMYMKVRPFFKKITQEKIIKLINKVYTASFYLSGSRDMAEHLTIQTYNLCKEIDLYFQDQTLWKIFCTLYLNEFSVMDKYPDRNQIEGRSLEAKLPSAILCLPPEERLVLLLREIIGFGYEEISQCINCSIERVSEIITRSRSHLRQELGNNLLTCG